MSAHPARLYANGSHEDGIAVRLLVRARIPYINLGPVVGESTPFLEYGYWRFHGVKGVREFVRRWCLNELPPLDLFRMAETEA